MRRQLATAVAILLCRLCLAQPSVTSMEAGVFTRPASGGVGFIIQQENFENTGANGYQSPLFNSQSTGVNSKWTPAMQGAQELVLTNGQFSRWIWQSTTNEIFAWFTCSNRTASVSSEIGEVDDGSGTVQGSINLNASGQLVVKNGAVLSAGSVGTVPANTKIFYKYHFKTDGTAYGEFSTTGTFTGSGNNFQSVSGGAGTAVQRWMFRPSGASATNYMDQLNISYTDPGLSPQF